MPAQPKSVRGSTLRKVALANGFRSGLEDTVSSSLLARGVADFTYEQHTLRYLVPSRIARYTPDFVLPNGIVVETKGRWLPEDRQKIELVMKQFPELELRIVFNNPRAKIQPSSKTTYAMVCEKLGIPFAAKDIPQAWLDEPPHEASLAILESMKK
jgi:hypothetical protein